jgi:hypothetical protein
MASKIKFLIVLLLILGCLYYFREPLSRLWANRAAVMAPVEVHGLEDIPFRVVKKEALKNGSYNLVVELGYRSRTAAVDIMIEPDLVAGQKNKNGSNGLIYLRSLGAKSDWFVQMLSDTYGVKLSSHKMATQVKFDMKIIEGVFDEIEQTPVRFRLTYPMLGADTFAVFYLDVDLPDHRILFLEKDMSYRKPLLSALTGE